MYPEDEYLDANALHNGPFSNELERQSTMKLGEPGTVARPQGGALPLKIRKIVNCMKDTYISHIYPPQAFHNPPNKQEAREFHPPRQPPSPRDTIDTY